MHDDDQGCIGRLRRNPQRCLTWIGWLWFAVLLCELVLRLRFPWDLVHGCESAFMIDMLKLHNHRSLFSSAADVSSSLYGPALEYLTYAILWPFGLALDV